jgi:hypothetical protein
MLEAAWYWGSDSSVINDPLEEQGHTPLYVGLPSTWGSVDGDLMFFPILEEGSFLGDSSRCLTFSWAHTHQEEYIWVPFLDPEDIEI